MVANVWARVSSGLVREITSTDPTNRFSNVIAWVQATQLNTPSGNVNAVTPRWTYDTANGFLPPTVGNVTAVIQSNTQYPGDTSFVGSGATNWIEIGNVTITASTTTAHFMSYATHVFDGALGASSSASSTTYTGGTYYTAGGAEVGVEMGGTNGDRTR